MQKLSAYELKSVETRATVNVVQPVEEISGKKNYLSRIQTLDGSSKLGKHKFDPRKKNKAKYKFQWVERCEYLVSILVSDSKKKLGLIDNALIQKGRWQKIESSA